MVEGRCLLVWGAGRFLFFGVHLSYPEPHLLHPEGAHVLEYLGFEKNELLVPYRRIHRDKEFAMFQTARKHVEGQGFTKYVRPLFLYPLEPHRFFQPQSRDKRGDEIPDPLHKAFFTSPDRKHRVQTYSRRTPLLIIIRVL